MKAWLTIIFILSTFSISAYSLDPKAAESDSDSEPEQEILSRTEKKVSKGINRVTESYLSDLIGVSQVVQGEKLKFTKDASLEFFRFERKRGDTEAAKTLFKSLGSCEFRLTNFSQKEAGVDKKEDDGPHLKMTNKKTYQVEKVNPSVAIDTKTMPRHKLCSDYASSVDFVKSKRHMYKNHWRNEYTKCMKAPVVDNKVVINGQPVMSRAEIIIASKELPGKKLKVSAPSEEKAVACLSGVGMQSVQQEKWNEVSLQTNVRAQ